MNHDREEYPPGLVIPGLQKERQRGPLLGFLAVILLTGIALVWPVYPFFSSIRPFILGFPLSFAWIIVWLLVGFGALVFFYRRDVIE